MTTLLSPPMGVAAGLNVMTATDVIDGAVVIGGGVFPALCL